MKLAVTGRPFVRQVAPFTGAWIETGMNAPEKQAEMSLPSRERGLKLVRNVIALQNVVAPFTGAWIETFLIDPSPTFISSLPSRERGLKRETYDVRSLYYVAPFTGAWIETSK